MSAIGKDSPVLSWSRTKFGEMFGADLRSLAAFRIVLALLVIADLVNRVGDLSAHYTDEGILPRDVLLEEGVLSSWSFSLNLINGQPLFQGLLFGVLALAAVGMLVGYRTRAMTVIVWVLLLSIQFRNPLLAGAGEPFLRLLIFWGMFLPLGAVWSVDRARGALQSRLSMRFLSVGTVALFMQIAFMYWFTAIQKSGDEWRVDGTALYYALSYDQVATQIGSYLLNFPELLKVMTFATIGLESFGPFLLFCPFFTGPVRTGAVAAFMSLHFGIWTTMDIGIFPWVSALCMICFLPAWFWDRVVGGLRAFSFKRPEVMRHLRSATSSLAHGYRMSFQTPASFIAGTGGSRRTSLSTEPARRGASAKSGPTALRSSPAINLLALFFLVYVFCWNLTTVSSFTIPERLKPVGFSFGLAQSWSMFAPGPSRADGWFVFPGTLQDGQRVDLMPVTRDDFALNELSWEKPRLVADADKNEHWRKYLQSIRKEENVDQRLYFSRYICREWNERHTGPERLETFDIVYMLETTQPDYRTTKPERVTLRNHRCL